MKKNVVGLVLASVMVVSMFAGCGKKGNTMEEVKSSSSVSSSSTSSESADVTSSEDAVKDLAESYEVSVKGFERMAADKNLDWADYTQNTIDSIQNTEEVKSSSTVSEDLANSTNTFYSTLKGMDIKSYIYAQTKDQSGVVSDSSENVGTTSSSSVSVSASSGDTSSDTTTIIDTGDNDINFYTFEYWEFGSKEEAKKFVDVITDYEKAADTEKILKIDDAREKEGYIRFTANSQEYYLKTINSSVFCLRTDTGAAPAGEAIIALFK